MKTLLQKLSYSSRIPVMELDASKKFMKFLLMKFPELPEIQTDWMKYFHITWIFEKYKIFRKENQVQQTSNSNQPRIIKASQHTAITPVRIKERFSI